MTKDEAFEAYANHPPFKRLSVTQVDNIKDGDVLSPNKLFKSGDLEWDGIIMPTIDQIINEIFNTFRDDNIKPNAEQFQEMLADNGYCVASKAEIDDARELRAAVRKVMNG